MDDGTKVFLLTRPRRFGKTLNMSMIKHFFDVKNAEENRQLFEDTLLAKEVDKQGKSYLDHQGKYPVLMISLKQLRANNYDEMVADIKTLMVDIYNQHAYLLNGDTLTAGEKELFQQFMSKTADFSDLKLSIKRLTEFMSRYYGQPIILLLDEYDTPMHSAFSAPQAYHDELLPFMASYLGETFKGNDALKHGIKKVVTIGMTFLSKEVGIRYKTIDLTE